MGLKEYQSEVIELLAQHEETVAEIYKAYAEKLPDKKHFWTVLHLEELDHAAWIRRLKQKVEEGFIYFNEERFKTETIRTSLDYLKEILSKVKKEKVNLKHALSTGMDIESSLIESKFYEVYETDDHEFRQLLSALAGAFKEHHDRLKDALEKTKKWDDAT